MSDYCNSGFLNFSKSKELSKFFNKCVEITNDFPNKEQMFYFG